MAATKASAKTTTYPEKLLAMASYMGTEGWEFTLTGDDSKQVLEFDTINGTLTLNSDGTWDYAD